MKFRRIVGASAGLLLGAGCASVPSTPQAVIPRLEAERAASPQSVPALRALGIQYYKAHQLPQARATLTEAQVLAPNDGVVALYLGLSAEAMNDLPAAKAAYSSYLKVGRTQRVRRQLEARITALQRRELLEAAKAAVQQESQLSATPGDKNTVAVMPFTFTGADSTLKPLERGFAELLTTDLSRVKALTVVERTRLQAILDEIKLQQAVGVDSTTMVRAGKLIQAGTLVQGSLIQTDDRLRTDAALVNVSTSMVGGTPATDDQKIDKLFDTEKKIALDLINALGVPITTAERNAIEQRPTKSLQAFLAYSQGLAYEDRGQYNDASRAFANASRIDPGFGAASIKSVESANMVIATSTSPAGVEASLQGSSEGAVVNASSQGSTTVAGGSNGTAQSAADQLNPSTIGAATSGTTTGTSQPTVDPSAASGADNPAKPQSKVVIVIKPPTE